MKTYLLILFSVFTLHIEASPMNLYQIDISPFATFIANKPGDVLTLVIEESAETKDGGELKLEKGSDAKFTLSKVFFPYFKPNIGFDDTMATGDEPGVNFSSESTAENNAENSSSHNFMTTVQIRLIEEVGEGQFFVKGHKLVTLNGKDKNIFVSGIIRQKDISPDNTIKSDQLADAVLEIDSKLVTKELKPSILTKIFNFIF